MKIYTRHGDDGTTGLFGGNRVAKSDARIECYGTVDELNAVLGLVAAAVPAARMSEIVPQLRAVQNELFVIGAHLATPSGSAGTTHLPPLGKAAVERLEHEIDAAEADLEPLRNFILPGGSEVAARLHLARTVCRRAERLLVAFVGDLAKSGEPPLATPMLPYLNRLSDWLFVQARWVNRREGVADVPWEK